MGEERIRRALTIAGSDPTGGAGLQLDLRVFSCHGVHGMAVATALTVQTTRRVHRVLPVFPSVVGEQLSVLFTDVRPDAIKIGMLATDDVLLRTAVALQGLEGIPRVLDPVLRASDGSFLLERRAWSNLLERLVPGAALVTPNLDEAEALTGTREPERAASALREMGAEAVLIKGGHAAGAPDDFLLSASGGRWLRGRRIGGGPVHGTGCALSSAVTAGLAQGWGVEKAVSRAKGFVERAIAGAYVLGAGARTLRLEPVDP